MNLKKLILTNVFIIAASFMEKTNTIRTNHTLSEGKNYARQRFIDFLKYYRPKHISEAIGIKKAMDREYPLWLYPWFTHPRSEFNNSSRCWYSDMDEAPDILTHFSPNGILSFRIQQEFYWLERALITIQKEGYQPLKYNNFVNSLELINLKGDCVYILMDGNHRISALSTLGYKSVIVQQRIDHKIFEKDFINWGSVKNSCYTQNDALAVFLQYFRGNSNFITTEDSAKIIEDYNTLMS